MANGRGKGGSDAELRQAVITGWHRLETKVRSNPDRLASLAKQTGLPFRQLDMARRVRNKVAHPDEPVPRERLLAALRIIADAEQQLKARKRPPSGRGRNTRRPQATRAKRPAPRTNRQNTVAAVVVLAVAAVALLLVLLLQG